MRLVVATALALCALASCMAPGAASLDALGLSSSAIQDGTADTTHTFAVGVCGGAPGSCSLECSGVLIAPNLVVTARHCVEVTNDAAIDCGTSQFAEAVNPPSFFSVTTDVSMHQSTLGWHRVSQVLTPGAGESSVCGDDVALLVLDDLVASSEAVPATPNTLTKLTDESVFEAAETAIGYGLSAGVPNPIPPGYEDTSGFRREREGVAILCIPDDPDTSLACDPTLAKMGVGEFVTGDATCEGDSGSGAFAQTQFDAGRFVVIGVLSRGSVDPSDATICKGGIYTRLDLWSGFLSQAAIAAAQLGRYSVPSWAVDADASVPSDGGRAGSSDTPGAAVVVVGASGGCALARARPCSGAEGWLAWSVLGLAAASIVGRRSRLR